MALSKEKLRTQLENGDYNDVLPVPESMSDDEIISAVKRKDGHDSGIDADTLDTKHASDFAPASLVTQITNPNILDNWYFKDPINQGVNGAFIDRWAVAYGSVVSSASGLVISAATWLLQRIENMPQYYGSPMTHSVEVDGVIYSGTITPLNASGDFEVYTSHKGYALIFGIYSGYFRLYYGGVSATVTRVKMEKGTISTLANDGPPNKTEQLIRCMRFYEAIINNAMTGLPPITFLGIASSAGTKSAICLYNWRVEKYRLPTITIQGVTSGNPISLRDAFTNIYASGTLKIDNAWDNQSKAGLCRIQLINPSSDFVPGGLYEAGIVGDATL